MVSVQVVIVAKFNIVIDLKHLGKKLIHPVDEFMLLIQ